jgi:signal transduction histidine kinase
MDDILNLTSMQHRRVGFAPIVRDLRGLLQEIIEEFSGSTQHVERIRARMPQTALEIAYDPRFMRQVLQNLFSNALKYSPQNQPVDVQVTQDHQQVTIEVRDYGIGIPAESLADLFKPFYRASNVGKIPGTGLGMVIVKEAVEMHGGTLNIESVLQQGTVITICLPKHG